MLGLSAGLAGLLAMLVGAGELMQRYRDAPFHVLITFAGFGYLALHAVAGAVAYLLLHQGNVLQLAAQDVLDSREILAAGFGTIAFFRSSFFIIRMDDKDIGLGPGIVLQQLFAATDRALDRDRAAPRSRAVRDIMRGVDFDLAAPSLPELCFNLMQNVSPEERAAFGERVSDLTDSTMDATAKAYSLGLGLMNIVGETVLREAVATLGNHVKAPTRASLSVIAGLRHVDYNRDGRTFAQACLTLSGGGHIDSASSDARVRLLARLGEIDKINLADDDKTLILVIELLNQFGEHVVSAALSFVDKDDRPAPAAPAISQPSVTPPAAPPPA